MSLVNDLIEAGIHYGQRRSSWNPKMKPYIYGTRNKIHILDIRQTLRGLLLAKKFIRKTVAEGQDVCFVGTKRQARGAVEKYATDVGMPFVIERWVGGTLTNFRTIRERLRRLEELEQLVETGEIQTYSKKMTSQLQREQFKIARNLQGIRKMEKFPGCLIIIDTKREINALNEARGLKIPSVALVDTDGDPDLVDIPIPGNDDSMRSIDVVLRELAEAVSEGKSGRSEAAPEVASGRSEADGAAPAQRRRSARSLRPERSASASAPAPASEEPPIIQPAATEHQAATSTE